MSNTPVKTNVGHRLPKDKALLALIGTIAIQYGQLDNQLKMIIMALTGVSKEEALAAYAREGSARLRDEIRAIAARRLKTHDVARVKLRALMKKAENIANRRNELLHGLWGTDYDTGRTMIGDELHNFQDAPSFDELGQLAGDLADLTLELVDARLEGFLAEVLRPSVTRE